MGNNSKKENIIYMFFLIGIPVLIFADKIFPALNNNHTMKWVVGVLLILYFYSRWLEK